MPAPTPSTAAEPDDPVHLPLLALIDGGDLPRTECHPCVYLPGLSARSEGFSAPDGLAAATSEALLLRGFRRSGRIFYRPRCPACRACVSIRIPVDAFRPSRSQRRVLRRNRDVRVVVGPPELSAAKMDLYRRYLGAQHPDSPQSLGAEALGEFLYESVVDSREIEYRRADDMLIGVSIIDVTERSVSSVYHYFDPAEARRSPGVFSVLQEIELAGAWDKPHYYLGFWIEQCRTMHYKAAYRPHELLIDGRWARAEEVVG